MYALFINILAELYMTIIVREFLEEWKDEHQVTPFNGGETELANNTPSGDAIKGERS